MNILRKWLARLRWEHVLGECLERYEQINYTENDRMERTQIIIPPDAPTFADVSFYQSGMDWSRYPHEAVILRIGQNIWKDSAFESFYASAKMLGLAVGGYWFYDDRVSPDLQAAVLISAMQSKTLEMELFIDYELKYGGAYFGLRHVKRMIELIEAAGVQCRTVGVYTGYYFWLDNTRLDTDHYPFFAPRPLWIAWYAAASYVKIPSTWTTWTHWQYDTPAIDWGQTTAEIDANRHNGTQAEFAERYLGAQSPMTTKTYIVGTTSEITIVRDLPKGAPINTLPVSVAIEGDRTSGAAVYNDQWIHIYKPLAGWVNKTSVPNWHWVTVTIEEPPVPPPPPVTKTVTVKVTLDVDDNPTAVNVDGVEFVRQ